MLRQLRQNSPKSRLFEVPICQQSFVDTYTKKIKTGDRQAPEGFYTIIGAALINAYTPTADAFVPQTDVSKNLDRGGSLSLPILY